MMNFFKRLGDEFLLFISGIRDFVFEKDGFEWFMRIILVAPAASVFCALVFLNNQIEEKKMASRLRMHACEEIGMAYIDDGSSRITCIDKDRNVVSIETNKSTYGETEVRIVQPEKK